MPKLIGTSYAAAITALGDLGAVEDRINAHDITSANRTVMVASNWRICTQSPKAGARLTAASVVELGVVKFSESC